jgi:hypothetical protein
MVFRTHFSSLLESQTNPVAQTLGKCGFKSYNCGEKCISNCDAKAMCGIDSADGQTSCGLKLCCSFYGWCGTEDVHCKDPEPQYGKCYKTHSARCLKPLLINCR